jgi:hypothetical protein
MWMKSPPHTSSRVNSRPSSGPDDELKYTAVASKPAVGEVKNRLGGAGSASALAMWRQQNSSDESTAFQDRQTARKRRMDLTGSRRNTSVIISSGRKCAAPDATALLLFPIIMSPKIDQL